MKKLEDLPKDVEGLFNPDEHHEINEDNLTEFAEGLKDILRRRLASVGESGPALRFSALGKPDRQIWYEAHPDGSKEPMTAKTYLKFLYGDLIEQLFIFLAKEAGHNVERLQEEVEVDGIKGHIDAVIDGVLVDVKSASSYGYKKFKERTVTEDDPFGYVAQLSGYASVLTPGKDAAWWAIDKVNGSNCISPLKEVVIRHHKPEDRIEELKKVISNEEPPERCYQPEPDGKSGNMRLPIGCSYCSHKFRCHPDVRTFLYSTGPRFLTKVVREPDVPEVTGQVLSDD